MKLWQKIGTGVVAVGMLGIGGLVLWNVFGMGPYNDSCRFTIGCKSYYCLHHSQRGSAQVSSEGYCTKSCSADSDCGDKLVCAKLEPQSLDDFMPFGKPDKACMRVIELPSDIRR